MKPINQNVDEIKVPDGMYTMKSLHLEESTLSQKSAESNVIFFFAI